MSLVSQAGAALEVLTAAGAAAALWLGSQERPPPVRRAYRWFAVAAAVWCVSVITGETMRVPGAAGTFPLSIADLPALLALPAMALGLHQLAVGPCVPREPDGEAPRVVRQGRGPADLAAGLADGYAFASALFVIGWVTLFGAAYQRAAAGPALFVVDLIRPLADLLALAATLPLAAAAGRRGAIPYLALLVLTLSDSLAVTARVVGGRPQVSALLTGAAAFGLLAVAPWAGAVWSGRAWRQRPRLAVRGGPEPGAARPSRSEPGAARPPRSEPGTAGRDWVDGGPGSTGQGAALGIARAGRSASALAVVAAVAVTAVALIAWGVGGAATTGPVVPVVAGFTVLTLALRMLRLVWREASASQAGRDSGRQFRQLAERTSDVVLLCGPDGAIRFVNWAVSGYGYRPEAVVGRPLTELLHPEDRSGAVRALRKAATQPAARAGRYPCRVRAADGTWRHVQSTVSRYRDPWRGDQVLITARDVSSQVELRRQVTHLTFHDGLTGLPNRAYLERLARDTVRHAADGASVRWLAADEAPGTPVAAAIFLDLDRFGLVNSSGGHAAGDLLLSQVAHRLRAAVPPHGAVGRWGGDEFGVLIVGEISPGEIADIAERLVRSVASAPFRIGDRDVSVTVSAGAALAAGDSPGYVWRDAETAMGRAKLAGGDRLEVTGTGWQVPVRAPGPAPAGAAAVGGADQPLRADVRRGGLAREEDGPGSARHVSRCETDPSLKLTDAAP